MRAWVEESHFDRNRRAPNTPRELDEVGAWDHMVCLNRAWREGAGGIETERDGEGGGLEGQEGTWRDRR